MPNRSRLMPDAFLSLPARERTEILQTVAARTGRHIVRQRQS